MVNDQEGEVVEDTCEEASIPPEVVESIFQHLLQCGVSEFNASGFCCMRFHPKAKWGLTQVLLDGKPTWAIVRPINDRVNVFAFLPTVDMISRMQPMPVANKYGPLN